jgi:hypothetical protein
LWASFWIWLARSAGIHSMPCAGGRSSRIRALVSMPVADQDDALERKALAEFGDLAGEGLGIGGVAGEDLDGDRRAVGIGEQPADDLPLAGLVVAGVGEFDEFGE